MKKLIKLIILAVVVVVVIVVVFTKTTPDSSPIVSESGEKVSFDKQRLGCSRDFRNNEELAFVGGAVIDINNDGKDEFFITNNEGEKNCLIASRNGEIVDIANEVGLDNTNLEYGVEAVDINNDGFTDLVVARKKGVHAYINNGGNFTGRTLYSWTDERGDVVDVSVSDYDLDGDVDIYASTFVSAEFFRSTRFNDDSNKQFNFLLENKGDLVFSDSTNAANLALKENTFMANFVDLNNDGWDDLVLGNNTNSVFVYKNNRGVFSLEATPAVNGFWMGLSVTDYDNDGFFDLFLSNTGSTIPVAILRGDLREEQKFTPKYVLLKNDGNFGFENILPTISTDDHAFGWGIIPVDLNLDNAPDYIVRQNYLKWPPHKLSKTDGAVLIQEAGKLLDRTNGFGLESNVFGFSALVGDINGDRLQDIVYLNLNGAHDLFHNTSEVTQKSLEIILPTTIDYKTVRVEVETNDGTSITRGFNKKQGIHTSQSSRVYMYFGSAANFKGGTLNIYSSNGTLKYSSKVSSDQNRIEVK